MTQERYLRSMVYTSRMLALLLSICIAVIATLFLTLLDGISPTVRVVIFLLTFSIGYLLIFVALEFLIFREISRLYKLMDKLKRKELVELAPDASHLNPLRKINAEIFSYADRKQNEIEELKKLEAFRKEFIADVSHELKTPIFAAQGFLHTLLDGAVHDKAVRTKFLEKAARSLDDLDRLVQDLLILSQIETGQIKMRFENIDLYRLTEEVFEQFERDAEKKDIKLMIESSSKPVVAYADAQRISQVMTNLISNAINHSFEGGEVIVRFAVKKKNVRVFVQDFGEGIPEHHRSRIFERFYRVDKSRSRGTGGTGLGLAIVKHILEGHDTRADVYSEPGKGSTFAFRLPRSRAEQPAKTEAEDS